MFEKEEYFGGTLRITNIKTLEKWLQNGNFQEELDAGYIYAPGCGRFRAEICTCSKCRKGKGSERKKLVEKFIERNLIKTHKIK